VAVVAAALLGGAVGAFLTDALRDDARDAPSAATRDRELRIERMEQRLVDVERKPARSRAEARAATAIDDVRADAEGPDAAALHSVDPSDEPTVDAPDEEFVQRVAAALGEIDRRKKAAEQRETIEQRRSRYLSEAHKQYANYRDPLALSDGDVTRLESISEKFVDQRIELQTSGADGAALAEQERAARREIRDVLGAERYRKLRGLELDKVARPVIVMAATRAGVDTEQRERIETLLSDHIERIVDYDVTLRTDEVQDDERKRIQDEMNRANREAWDRIRNDILTQEQRGRVPERL
jgi:hypothetical protein